MQFELAPFALPVGYGESILPIEDAKAHLYVDHDDDDDLIVVMRDVAVDFTERYCSVRLLSAPNQIYRAEGFASPLRLGVTPLVSIESIDYLDSNGDAASILPADIRIGLHGEILPAIGDCWPTDVGGGVEISFTAGFVGGAMPAGLIGAAKLFLGHLYANREDVIVGSSAMVIPNGFSMMCGQYRQPVI